MTAWREGNQVGFRRTRLVLLCMCLSTFSAVKTHGFLQNEAIPSSKQAVHSATPSLPVIKPAPDFTLLDTAGHPVRSSELRGQVVLLSFIYTRCPAACPLLTARMSALWKRLVRERDGQGRVRFLSITVDPVRDSATELERYAKRFKADLKGWKFLREEPQRLGSVLAAYDEWTRPYANGEIDHPARLYLIDPQGRIREIYSLSFFDERQAFLDIQALLQESP